MTAAQAIRKKMDEDRAERKKARAELAQLCPQYRERLARMEPKRRIYYTNEQGETARLDDARLGVAQKCTFCSDRIDSGLEKGLTPGVDPEATPACVNSCIADALQFGDVEDADSNVSELLAENAWFQMHAELGTDPGFYYLWDEDKAAKVRKAMEQ